MPKVKVGDIHMYYEVHGKGEPLAFILGMDSNISSLFRRIPVFAREYKVIAFDNRGTGRSDVPDNPYTIETMADDLAGLLNIIGIDQTHIYGISMGGGVAQTFALRYPKRVISLILACTSCGGAHAVPPDKEYIRYISDVARLQKLTLEEKIRERMRFFASQEFIDNNPGFMKELVIKLMEYPTTPQGLAGQMQMAQSAGTYEHLPEIKAPTLVIHGDADQLVPVENAHILASRIAGAELVILKNMRHGFAYEAEEESNRIIMDFLRRHSTKKA